VEARVASELAQPATCQSFSTFATLFRPEAASQTNPYIVFATLRYDSLESRDKALVGFSGVCEFSRREEPGTLWYNVLCDDAELTQMRTLEMYIDKDYLWDPHAASDAVQDNKKRQGNTRLSVDFVFLRLVEARL
jgi:quinol monooxygenase YgiN